MGQKTNGLTHDISQQSLKLYDSINGMDDTSAGGSVEFRDSITCILTGLAVSGGIGYLAWKRGSLSGSGVTGALLTGTLTTAGGGYTQGAMLVGFFGSSTILPKLVRGAYDKRFDAVVVKGGRRDLRQVLANGGVATALVLRGRSQVNDLGYLGALAAVNGDTWATEIGKTSPQPPRHILTGRQIEPGLSGGVSLRGTLASIAGGAFIGAIAATGSTIDGRFTNSRSAMLLCGAVAGGLGSLADSVLGATVQERRWCPACQSHTERDPHTCGTETELSGGIPGVSNDVVNLVCSQAGAAIGILTGRYLSPAER